MKNEDKEEVLYLRGLMASHLDENTSLQTAEETFSTLIANYPQGQYADSALYGLGTLAFRAGNYEKAEHYFVTLAQNYSQSSFAGEAWYWAAEAAEKRGSSFDHFRKKAYVHYPQSPHADEAYFKMFDFRDYVEGKSEALEHLNLLATHFPESPLKVAAFYLLALHESSFVHAQKYLQLALLFFDQKLKEGLNPSVSLVYFRYRTQMELAELYLNNPDSNERRSLSISLLKSLINDFENPHHPLTAKLKTHCQYPPLHEEGEFLLAQAYLKTDQIYLAQEMFSKMLAHYSTAGIKEGYFLAKVWQEQGTLASQCSDFETALHCFRMSEECGRSHFSTDELLSLWILESDCYRGKGNLDQAMRMLSQVINQDVVSPLRIKAMLLRSEIYELQGRGELAIRQLESTAKKGGSWGLQAKERLKERYGIES